MNEKELVCRCLWLAFEGNCERMGSSTEQLLLGRYLEEFPQYADDLLATAIKWVSDDEDAPYDIAINRFQSVYDGVHLGLKR